MAEKLFTNVRLGLKVDTLESWKSSGLVLKRGEVAFATIAASEGIGLSEPVVMMKIGDGEHTFSELGFDFYAKASDVVAAAKSEASLRTFINGVIADAGIATDEALTALAGKVTTAEGKITTLEGTVGDSTKGLVKGVADNAAAIDALETLVGDTAVATQITNAIAELKLGETYAAKSLETTVDNHIKDTVAHVTADDKVKWNNALQNTDVTTGSANGTISVKGNDVAVKGLGSAAYTESTAYDASGAAATAEANAKAYAKEYADGLAGNYDAKGAAATAESNAKAYAKEYADGLAGNYDAAGSAADALEEAKGYTDAEIEEWVGTETVAAQIATAITNQDLANKYDAKGAADAVEGKLNTHISEAAAAYETKTDAAAKLTEAKDYTDDEVAKVQNEVDALETYVGTFTASEGVDTVVKYIDAKTANIASNSTVGEIADRVTAVENELNTAETGLKARVTAVEGAIDAVEADYLKAADKTELQDQITELDGLVGDKKVSEQITDVTNPLDARIKAIEDDYLTSADKTELEGKIKSNADAIELLTNGVSAEEVDGVNDLIQYVKEHGTEVTGIKADIKANADAIAAIPQADWAQNDETAPDYIKNRPFYGSEKELGEVVFDGVVDELTYYERDDLYDSGYIYDAEDGQQVIVGELYEITIDGTVYNNVVCTNNYYPLLGDASLAGYPFQIQQNTNSNQLMFAFKTGEPRSVKIVRVATPGTIVQIDDKFIPDTIARVADVETAQADLGALTGRVEVIEGDLNAETTDLKARMTAAEADIDALEAKVGDETVAAQIEAALEIAKTDASNKDAVVLAEAQRGLEAHTGNADIHVTKSQKDTWDAAVQTVTAAADSGLKAVKTGTDVAIELDDSIVWVFDCGTSAV